MGCEGLIQAFATEMGIELQHSRTALLAQFIDLLLTYDHRVSLTAMSTEEEIIEKLLMDSLAVSFLSGFTKVQRCLDIGPGGGFPSVPLAIISPQQSWIAVERNSRKAAFLSVVQRQLSLVNYSVVNADFNRIPKPDCVFSQFDLVTARAVKLDARLSRGIMSILSSDGVVVLFRHWQTHSQIEARRRYGSEKPADKTVSFGKGRRAINIKYLGIDWASGA